MAVVLFNAVQQGNVKEVARLIDHEGFLIEEENEDEVTPLMLASMLGLVPMVTMLVKKGADVDTDDENENSALHMAAWQGYEGVADTLLGGGADPMSRNVWEETPLMLAAEEGRLEIVTKLLPRVGKGGLDASDSDGHTALFGACMRGQAHVAKALLRAGADPSVKNRDGHSILQVATSNGMTSCVELLQWWEGEQERVYTLYRARRLDELSTPYLHTLSAHVPAYLQPRLMHRAPLPTVEILALPGERAQGRKAAKRPREDKDKEEQEETTRAVVGFLIHELSQDLFWELMEAMRPC